MKDLRDLNSEPKDHEPGASFVMFVFERTCELTTFQSTSFRLLSRDKKDKCFVRKWKPCLLS